MNIFPGFAVRVVEKSTDPAAIACNLVPTEFRRSDAGQVVVEVAAAGVNPSDAKAVMGQMPYAVWPRTPGRDFAGTVVEGPPGFAGRAVWGSGGELGIRRDGSHATHLVVDAASVAAKPAALGMAEAGGVGVPFITALEGLRRAGFYADIPAAEQLVLVMGVNGKVGQAAAQLATLAGAQVVGVTRRAEPYQGHASSAVQTIDASVEDVPARLREISGGRLASIVFNTVGSPYFAAACNALAHGSTQIIIASIDPVVPFPIFAFFRARHTYVGVDTLALPSAACARMLESLAPGFESGGLRGFPVAETVPLGQAAGQYSLALQAAKQRLVLAPGA